MSKPIDFRPVILAGGSGTRFWPRSRRAHAKQVLALDGERSMIQQTVERLKPLAGLDKTWVITNEYLAHEIADQLPGVPASADRPGAGGAQHRPGLRPGRLPHRAPEPRRRARRLSLRPRHRRRAALPQGAAKGHRRWPPPATTSWCWASSPPAPKPATATSRPATSPGDDAALHVRRFIEKPNQNRAEEFVAAGNYYWNSGMFLWSARTLANAVREHLPETAPLLEGIAAAYGTPAVRRGLPRPLSQVRKHLAWITPCSSRARPRASTSPTSIACLPSSVWNDLGSWASLYEYQLETRLRGDGDGNVAETEGHLAIDAGNNYIYSPKKFVALVGVENLVIVDTEDALLIAHRDHSQDVGKIVKELASPAAPS